MGRLAMFITGLALLAALTACGGETGSSADESDPASKSSSSTSDDGGSPSSSPDDGEEPTSGTKTLTGTISEGVEPGCLMLKSEGVKYQLVGDAAQKLKSGMKVEVTGKVSDNAMSTCMEGTAFEVDSVKKL